MDTRNINVITLAYLGDAIYEVYIRKHLIEKGIALVDDLQKEAVKYVSAKSQSKRGRNYKRGSHPKNTDIITYKNSTGFEALIGYLYLEKENDRIDELMKLILEEFYEKNI